MKAISVRQPWAHLLVYGLKTIEIRNWTTNYRGRLSIHASRTVDELAMHRTALDDLPTGVILGYVDLISIEKFTPESWLALADEHLDVGCFDPSLYAWKFANPTRLEKPIPMSGKMGLFEIELSPENESHGTLDLDQVKLS